MCKQGIILDVDGVIFIKWKLNSSVCSFIKENFDKYLFFTNTTFTKSQIHETFLKYWLEKYFMELLSYDDWDKKQNIQYIIDVYDIHPEKLLFIDDMQGNIDFVRKTWIHTLLFKEDGVSLVQKISEDTQFTL